MFKDSSKEAHSNWNPWLGVLVAIITLFGSQLLASLLLLSLVSVIKGWSYSQAVNWLNNTISAQFIFVLIVEVLVCSAIYCYLRPHKGSFKAIGLHRPKSLDPLYGLLGLPAYLALYFLLLNIVLFFVPGINTSQKQHLGFNNPHGAAALTVTFISLVILPPIGEEIIFRGLVYTSLKRLMPLWWAAGITSLLFAAGHLPEGGSSGPLYIAAIDTFSLSLVLVYLREKTGRLWAGMTLHALKNVIAFIALFALHLGG